MRELGKRAVNLAGDMIAKLGAAPIIVKGADRRTLVLPEARALGEPEDLFRLVPGEDAWRLERREGTVWREITGYDGLEEHHGRVADLGNGETFVVLTNAAKRVLIDIHGGLSRAPLGLTYSLPAADARPPEGEMPLTAISADVLVPTPRGRRPASSLKVGDLVIDRRGRTTPVARVTHGTSALLQVPAGAFGQGLPLDPVAIGPANPLVIRSELAARSFGEAEIGVPARLFAAFQGVALVEAEPTVSVVLEFASIVVLSGLEVMLPGQPGLENPRLAQGRRAVRVVGDHARSGRPILTPPAAAKAAE